MRRIISSILIFTLLGTIAPTAEIANALSVVESSGKSEVRPGGGLEEIRDVNSVETRYGLVALLVDSSVWENSESYDGLSGTFSFGDKKLSERITRYAEDIQASVPWTKTMIITVDDEDTTVEIQETLERLYYEGNPDDGDTTKLSGVVLIGDVPLPVVTKSGHRFISMLPYTDFEDPSYVLNSETQDFERNEGSENLQADVWHGLIIPPIDGDDGNKLLAQYFDKNHYYHTGEEDYATFDKKTFVGDLVTEGATINEVSFKSYDRFLNYWEELAYYRYTNSWLEEIYVDMADSVEAGDGLDNDSDGTYDEEAANGEDEDGDGLIDEDLGDGFFQIDNDGDGLVDEDSFEDNNNDKEYVTPYADSKVPFYRDRVPDEDPPGDSNGDGCPGLCGKDDNGNSVDHDEDGFPSAIEALGEKGWNDRRWPWADPVKFAKDFFGVNPSNVEEAAEMLGEFFIDEDYELLALTNSVWEPDASCYEGATYHPEWDDDEDGFCDEDGANEVMENGCMYNDADCDGVIDEDPAGMPSDPAFDQLPDIQSKKLIENLISRYVDIFEQPQGVWNRLVNGTGRYSTRYEDEDGGIKNDYDSAVSLIAKKDEATLQYLRAVNDVFEARVNTMAESLQEDIPMVAYVKFYGDYTLAPADEEEEEPEPVDLCDPDATFFNPEDQCVQFINHIADAIFWENAGDISLDWMYMWGRKFKDVTDVKQCSETAGTYEEGGRFVQKSGIYSRETSDVTEVADQEQMAGCFIANASNYMLDDEPMEVCFPAVAKDPVTFVTGAKKYTDDLETTENEEQEAYERIEQGAPACFEFRELDTYQIYYKVNKTFSDWLVTKTGQPKTQDLTEEEWLQEINDKKDEIEDSFGARPTEVTLKKHFDEIPIYQDGDAKYTVRDYFTELGYGSEYSDEELDVVMAYENGERIEYPSEGRNMDDVAELDIEIEIKYMNEGKNGLTDSLSDAFKMSSLYIYDEPNNDTLNAQIQDGAVPNLPIDATRRVTFLDESEEYKELEYINIFDADSATDVEAQIAELADQMAEVEGGSAYVDDIEEFMDELNLAQLEDAFEWRDMNIDEKHKYVFSHYLGDGEAITSEVTNGYEIVSVISKGDANNMYFAFNGNSPATEGDLEWQYRSQEAIEAALAEASSGEEETYEPISEVEGTTPIALFDWIEEMQVWLEETEDSLSSFDTDGGELVCGDALELGGSANNEDADASGVPDAADDTVSIRLTSEDNNVLQANGDDYYVVTASARKSDGTVNTSDNFTEINLAITSGDNTIEVSGNDTLKLTAGIATFLLKSKEAGSFTIKGEIENRDISDTNSLSGTVTSKYVKVSSFVIDEATSTETVTSEGDNIEVSDDDGNIIAVLNTVSGDLELRDAEAALVEAESASPTKISISKDGEIYGYFYIIPDNKKVFIGEGANGVYVSVEDSSYSAEKVDEGVALMSGTSQVGLVTALGQIAVAEGLYLNFSNSGEINIFDPILVSNSSGKTLFEVTIKSKDKDFELLGFLKNLVKPAFAAEISDTDGDNLDDLEEWTIGTDAENEDSDGDGYKDGVEVFTGYDPLESDGARLFSDVGSTHEAYASIVILYLRGILNGYGDGSFRPDSPLTREEFMKIDLGSICISCTSFAEDYLNTLMSDYSANPFPDSNINGELLACVAEGKTREIVSGYKSGDWIGYFLPQKTISRAEATKVLLETAGYSAEDATSGAWYSNYAALAESMDIFPAGDFADNLEQEISRGEFAMMAVNLLDAKDCRDTDSDADGLSDAEEDYRYGTDKNLADTDNGGVNDFDEVVRGSDPLDASDDIAEEVESGEVFDLSAFEHDSGVFGEGEALDFEEIASSLDLSSDELKQFTDEVPADGESAIYVQAEIRDQDGNIYIDDDLSVIEFILSTSDHGDLIKKRVQVSGGTAETVLRSTILAGEVEIVARITDGSLPSQDALVNVYAGEASSLEIDAESTILPVGGESVDDIQINLYDDFGNLANYGFHTVTVISEGGIEVLDLSDEDPETEGTQVSTSEGYIKFRILSSETADTSTLRASIVGKDESGYSIEIDSIEGMKLALSKTKDFLIAGGNGTDEISVSVTDASGSAITEFQGDVDLSLSDSGYGTFAESSLSLSSGTAKTRLVPGTLAGTASILVSSNGIASGSLSMEFKPADPFELKVRKDDGTTIVEANEAETFYVEVYDEYGNLVSNDSSTTVDLRLTDATKEFGRLGRQNVKLNQGSASFRVTIQDISGKLNLVAASTGLVSGSFGGDISYSMGSDEFRDIDPEMLFGSFLGGAYGDVTQDDYIGGWLTFNGKTQALTTLLQEPTPKQRIATVDGNGAISLPAGSVLTQTVSPAGSSLPMRVSWRSFPEDILQAELLFVLPSASTYTTATLLSASSDFELEAHESGYLLREEEAGVVKVRSDGQIELLDSNYNIAVSGSSDGLAFVVSKATQQVLHVEYEDVWATDVSLLDDDFDLEDWSTLSSGIYIRPTAASENYFVSTPSGNSSENPMGMALIDPEKDLPEEMQPSLGYQSLENAINDGSVGWENENKHLLLFSAGNTVGESNLYYTSEVGVVLGDPTVTLTTENEANAAGFTKDVGKMVYTSSDEILSLMDIDYNGDELEDVLIAYEDGRIDVLQNNKSPNRLNNRGTILQLENGISSIDKGEFNGDDLEDLLVVTEESCLADEMCLYVFENIDGGFVSSNLTFEAIDSKPKQVEVGDLNNDDLDDLVVLSENLGLYVIWNQDGTFDNDNVEELKDFGLNIGSGQNLFADIALHYDGLEEGSLTLPIPSRGFASGSLDTNLTSLVNSFLNDDDYETVSGDLESKSNKEFEYAESLSESFEITKTLSDSNGGNLNIGDEVTVTVTIKNISGAAFEDIYLSDKVAGSFTFDSTQNEDFANTGDVGRPAVYGPLNLANGEEETITYELELADLPKMYIMLAHDFYSDYKDDNYLDIAVSPEGNSTGTLLVFYSDSTSTQRSGILSSLKTVNYKEQEYTEEAYEEEYDTSVESPDFEITDEDGNNVPDAFDDISKKGVPVTEASRYFMEEVMGASDSDGDGFYGADEYFVADDDADNDGLNDLIDSWQNSATAGEMLLAGGETLEGLGDGIEKLDSFVTESAGKIEEIVSMFTCNGGCLAFSSSVAFLAPGQFHEPFTGMMVGADNGTPLFGIYPAPTPPVVCVATACTASTAFRFYLAPTTTLGIGIGICLGTYGTGKCWAFNLPLLQLLGVCDALNGFVADSLSKASSFTAEGGNQAFNIKAEGSAGGSGIESDTFDGYEPPVSTHTNIQIPGFPSIFTEWWKRQKNEFYKMLDLPDIIFIYPDPNSIKQAFSKLENNPVLELETNIFGLEKFINFAHSLPIVDIDTEKVYIKYPALTPEEIQLTKQDWENWIEDTKEEFKEFEESWVPVLDVEVAADISAQFEGLIAAMENNLEVLDSYGRIPEEILKIREIEAYYAKVIICYLDAILGFTAGYLTENVERIQAWAKWVKDLEDIVGTWQGLFKISSDMMESCDKCTNQRYSGFQLIASLFVFIPDLPVIEMPKLPDIVIDTSNIQAGVDIIWPDVVFVPESLNIPKIPRIKLPRASINVDADISASLSAYLNLNIPTLPEFEINLEIPELPGLALPDLPDIPPPPALPEIDATLSASLSIVSTIIRVICIIRQGFIPTDEMLLKGKIEEITERPGSILLPSDLEITTEFPSFSFDFLKRIEINTYLNLTTDLTILYDLIKGIGDESNEFIENFIDDVDAGMQSAADSVQDDLDEVGDEEIEVDVEVDAEAEAEAEAEVYNPAQVVADSYINHPLVHNNIVLFQQSLKNLQSDLKNWDPGDDVNLVAEQRILALDDPLLNNYDNVSNKKYDSDFIASIQNTPLAGVANIRDSLIAKVENLENGNRILANADGEKFYEYLAMEYDNSQYTLAENEEKSLSTGDLWDFGKVEESEDIEVDFAEEETSLAGATAVTFNEGLYIYNEELGISERLTQYTQEAGKAANILFLDIDNDDDDDIIYSSGGDVYIKENHTEEANLKYVSESPSEAELDDVAPVSANVKNLKRGENNNEESNFSFSGSDDAIAYDVSLYDSLDAIETAQDENVKRLLLLSETENESFDFGENGTSISLPDGYEFREPTIRTSKLTVKNENGTNKLYNAYERTLINADGELSSGETITFQTLEETTIEVNVEGNTITMKFPANILMQFPRLDARTIRVESGKVIWVGSETVYEQDIIEGMEIFKEEIVNLESGGAGITLETSEGAEVELDNEELFVMERLSNPENPTSQVELENGAYYVTTRALYTEGYATRSDNILLNPQICADDSSPYPVISEDEIDVAIFSTKDLSAESSFDTDSDIVDAYWDLDDEVDVDGDGVTNNDEEVIGLTAEVGPYEDADQKTATLWVTDTAGNEASATVKVNIYIPDITITAASTEEVSGTTNPLSPEFPFHLVRERSGTTNEIGNGYLTDEEGNFAADISGSDLINVYDENNAVIARFNPDTKQLLVYDDDYEALALESGSEWPSRLIVAEKALGTVMASFLIVSDGTDINVSNDPLEETDLSKETDVTVYEVSDTETFVETEEGYAIRDEFGVNEFIVRTDGNISFYDTRFELVKREASSLDEYLILELYSDGELVLEIYPGSPDNVTITTTDALGLPASEAVETHDSLSADTRLYFEDIEEDDAMFEEIGELVERGVLEGYEINGKRYFKPNQEITRAEFTKIILAILCIVPSDEAYGLPSVFTDITSTSAWYFPFTKEAYLRDLITGYLGETNSEGDSPFKPSNTINRAEAAKIVLEALDKEEIINLPEVSGSPWYAPYMTIAKDISSYLIAESSGEENFILTDDEASDPSHEITRYEFVEMSVRVLQAYNCFDLDSDGDTLINYDEESKYGSDAYNPDTDGGGVDDGTEVNRGSDPLDPEDDFPVASDLDLEAGIYAVQEPCISCPCLATIDYDADLRAGDTVFAIIQNEAGEIFGISNKVEITD